MTALQKFFQNLCIVFLSLVLSKKFKSEFLIVFLIAFISKFVLSETNFVLMVDFLKSVKLSIESCHMVRFKQNIKNVCFVYR